MRGKPIFKMLTESLVFMVKKPIAGVKTASAVSLLMLMAAVFGYSQSTWECVNPKQWCQFYGMAYGNNKFVGVGKNGKIQTSVDGLNWENQNSGITNNLRSITFGKNMFVAVGDDVILSSVNGIDWVVQKSGTGALNSVIYANECFVAVGIKIFFSRDTLEWEETWAKGVDFWHPLKSVAYGREQFVAVGEGAVISSRDGIGWQLQESAGNRSFSQVIHDSTQFVISLGPISSENAVEWKLLEIRQFFSCRFLGYAGGKCIMLMHDDRSNVTDTNFLLVASDLTPAQTVKITYCPDPELLSICSGNGMIIGSTKTGRILKLISDSSFVPINKDLCNSNLGQILFSDSLFWIFLKYETLSSENGLTWKKTVNNLNENMERAICAQNVFLGYCAGQLVKSANGVDWVASDTLIKWKPCLTYGNGMFVESYVDPISKSGQYPKVILRCSTNGSEWENVFTDSGYGIVDMKFMNGKYYALSKGFYWNGIIGSNDGKVWTKTPFNHYASSMAFGNSIYIAVGLYACLYNSLDGIGWKEFSCSSGSAEYILTDVAFGGGVFVAVGGENVDYYATGFKDVLTFSQTDNGPWKKNISGLKGCMNAVAYGNSRFVAVGNDGLIATSGVDEKSGIQNKPFRRFQSKFICVKMSGRSVTVNLNEPVKGFPCAVYLSDLQGRTRNIEQFTFTGSKISFPLSDISPGRYIISVSSKNNTIITATFVFTH